MTNAITKILSNLLRKIANDLDSGSYESDEEQVNKAIDYLSDLNSEMPMGKEAACYYLGLSRSTFDTYVREGKIPKGKKHRGLKEKTWKKTDLDRVKL